jgi:hypothetical protein
MGRTFKEGKPGNGIFVPGTNSGLNDTPVLSGSSNMLTLELHAKMSGSPMVRFGDGMVSVEAKSKV